MIKRFFTGICIALTLFLLIYFGHSSSENLPKFIQKSPILLGINNHLQQQEFDRAFALISTTIESKQFEYQPETLSWLFEQQAFIYQRRYHFHLAIESLTAAHQLQPITDFQTIRNKWQKHIDNQQTERSLKSAYISGSNKGLAKEMTNTVNLAYVYINDRTNAKWTGKRRLMNQETMKRVVQWYQRESETYLKEKPTFNIRYFVINSPRGIEKNWLRQYATFDYLADVFIKQSAYTSLSSFIRNMRGDNSNNQVALVFHSNYQGRSYALRCHHRYSEQSCPTEYTLITEDLSRKKMAWAIPQVQAHEILHLFGADDLYNIEKSKNYAVTDVMNYYSSDLTYATIDPITAWAIGWGKQPITPFKVEK